MWIWAVTFIFVCYCVIILTMYVYTGINIDFTLETMKASITTFKKMLFIKNPKFWLVFCIDSFTISMCIYAGLTEPYYTDWILFISVVNLIIYFVYYIFLKIINKEHISIIIKIGICIDLIISIISFYFYFHTNYNSLLPIAKSNELNEKCILFNYFDNHDLWHLFSAIGFYIFMNIILFIDYDIDGNIEEILTLL